MMPTIGCRRVATAAKARVRGIVAAETGRSAYRRLEGEFPSGVPEARLPFRTPSSLRGSRRPSQFFAHDRVLLVKVRSVSSYNLNLASDIERSRAAFGQASGVSYRRFGARAFPRPSSALASRSRGSSWDLWRAGKGGRRVGSGGGRNPDRAANARRASEGGGRVKPSRKQTRGRKDRGITRRAGRRAHSRDPR